MQCQLVPAITYAKRFQNFAHVTTVDDGKVFLCVCIHNYRQVMEARNLPADLATLFAVFSTFAAFLPAAAATAIRPASSRLRIMKPCRAILQRD